MIRRPSGIVRPVTAALEMLPPGTAPGIVLMLSAALALIVANSPLHHAYEEALHTSLGPLTIHGWITDALMALFFFQVGLEVKRELVEGDLSTPSARRVPMVAAVCGMAAPAAVYLAIAGAVPGLARGWAIASATDIAFALGVLALLGPRAPASLRLLLTTIAVADDMGAVVVIAVGYTTGLNVTALGAAGLLLIALWALNRRGVLRAVPYLFLTVFLWIAVYRSGVHATVAGVLGAMFVPLGKGEARGPLEDLEHGLAPWIAYLVLPVFGFASAGVNFGQATLIAPLPIAVMMGLFLGKQLGVFAAIRGMSLLGFGGGISGVTWAQLYGLSLLTGIGFTMSLFIANLAFVDPLLVDQAKLGILAGSILSGGTGFLVLWCTSSAPKRST